MKIFIARKNCNRSRPIPCRPPTPHPPLKSIYAPAGSEGLSGSAKGWESGRIPRPLMVITAGASSLSAISHTCFAANRAPPPTSSNGRLAFCNNRARASLRRLIRDTAGDINRSRLLPLLRRRFQHIDRYFHVHRLGAGVLKGGKKPRQHRGYIGRLQNGVRIGKQTCRRLALIGQFVQHPAPMTEILSGINAANDQQGNGILSRLRHRRGNVSKPGPGDCSDKRRGFPVRRAYPSAMNPAPCSWRGVMWRILPFAKPR